MASGPALSAEEVGWMVFAANLLHLVWAASAAEPGRGGVRALLFSTRPETV